MNDHSAWFAYKPVVKAELVNTVRKVLDEAKSLS